MTAVLSNRTELAERWGRLNRQDNGESSSGAKPAAEAASEQLSQFSVALLEPNDIAEIRLIRGGQIKSRWQRAADLPAQAESLASDNANGSNVYVGINPRQKAGERGDSSVLLARCAFVDFDDTTIDEARERIQDAGLPTPTLIVSSGHGAHVYWRFNEPCTDLAAWKQLQADLARLLGSDGKVVNPERIMRAPGFYNLKSEPVLSQIVDTDATARTAFDALRAIVPAKPQPPAAQSAARSRISSGSDNRQERCRAFLAAMPPAIGGQGGHDQTFQAARECFRFALSESEALAQLEIYNGRCQPAWAPAELAHKIHSAKIESDRDGDFGRRLDEQRPQSATPPRTTARRFATGISSDNRAVEAQPAGITPLGERTPDGYLLLNKTKTPDSVRALIREHFTHPDGPTIRHYGGNFVTFEGNRYEIREAEAIKQIAFPMLHAAKQSVLDRKTGDFILTDFPANPGTVNAVIDSAAAIMHLPASKTPPCWLSPRPGDPKPSDLLPTPSGNLHIPTGRLLPPTPALFNFSRIDFDYDRHAEPPECWIKFLEQLWGDDLESTETLQEWFGYLLVGNTSLQKMLLLVGPKRSGKGTIARVLRSLVGADNVTGPTTSSLATPFGLQPLIGKTLAIVSDARFAGPTMSIVTERLLCVSGEDALSIDRKYQGAVTMTLPTRFMFLSNELPKLSDSSGALAGRFIVLNLRNSFYGREDHSLTAKLAQELPGILLWSIDGLKRLLSRGHFIQPESSREAIQELEDLGSPIGAFVREWCEVGPGKSIPVAELYEAWNLWCESQGRDHVTMQHVFGRDLRAAVPGMKAVQSRDGGHRSRCYEGIDLTPDARATIMAEKLPSSGGRTNAA